MVARSLLLLFCTAACLCTLQAQTMFYFQSIGATGTCEGNLVGVVNSAGDCCLPSPRGLGGGGYVRYVVQSKCMEISEFHIQLYFWITAQSGSTEILANASEIQDIRLVNGNYGQHLGRVEILYNGTWGTICDDFWSYSDARVACRMLGFQRTLCAVSRGQFGRGQGPIWMDNLQCRGNELSLEDCIFNGWGVHSCTHAEDAGLICAADGVVEAPTNVEVVGTSTTTLIVQWNTPNIPPGVTGQRYRVTYQSEDSSFPRIRYLYPSRAQSRASRLNVTITRLQRDTEYLIQVRVEVRYRFCYSYLYGNFSEPIFGSTNATRRVSSLQVRLVPPQSGLDFLGRLEVLHNGVWGTVCDDRFGFTEAGVVCSMLNYTRAICSVPNARLGQGRGQIWMDDVDCAFGHEVLDECSFRGWGVHNCQHNDDVGVMCRPNDYPGGVNNLTVTAVAPTSVTLKWDPFPFPSIVSFARYRISYRRPQDSFTRSTIVSSRATQTTLQFLQFGASYNFSIRAELRFSYCFSYLYGDYSDPVNATTMESEPTGPPTSFHAVVLNSTAIEVQWNLPLFNLRNGIIRGYKLFVQQENQEEMAINISDNRTTEYILSRLDPGEAYIVSVLAYTVGDGPRSIHLTVITPLVSTNCIVEFGINGDGLDKVIRYSFQRDLRIHCRAGRPEAEVDWFYTNGTKIGSTDRNFREGHYKNGTTVLQIGSRRRLRTCDAGTYTCVANCSDGVVQSRNFTLVISTIPPAPTRPVIIRVGSNWVTISWSEPVCTGGHTIVSYTIQYGYRQPPFFFRDFRYIRNINASLRSYTISNLESDTSYTIAVRAVSADFRDGSLSRSRVVRTLPPGPSAPRNIRVRLVTPLLVEIRWARPDVTNGQVIRFTVYGFPIAVIRPAIGKRQAPSDLPPGTIKQFFPGSVTSGNITLTNHSVTYQFQMTASTFQGGVENEGNLSMITPQSTLFIPEPGLPVPQNVRVVGSTNSSITLVWNLPPPPQEIITNFKVSYTGSVEERSRGGTLIQFEESGSMYTGSLTSVTISPLTPSTRYRFRVAAETERGQGAEVIQYGSTNDPFGDRLAYFHIRIGPIIDCVQWHDEDAPMKLADIRKSILSYLNSQCSCDLTSSYIQNEELSCRQSLQNQISYRARIIGTDSYSANGLLELLQAWVLTGMASVTVGVSRLEIDRSCLVFLDNLNAPDCPPGPSGTPPTGTTPPSIPTSTATKPITITTQTTTKPVTITTQTTTKPVTTQTTTKPITITTQTTTKLITETIVGVVGLSGGEIGGIIVGLVIAILLVVLVVLLFIVILKKWNSMNTRRQNTEDNTPGPFAEIRDGARGTAMTSDTLPVKENLGNDL